MSDPKIRILKLNVLYRADVDAEATVVEKEAGSLDVLIFNAGAANNGSPWSKAMTMNFRAMVGINAVAPPSRHFSLPALDSQGGMSKRSSPSERRLGVLGLLGALRRRDSLWDYTACLKQGCIPC